MWQLLTPGRRRAGGWFPPSAWCEELGPALVRRSLEQPWGQLSGYSRPRKSYLARAWITWSTATFPAVKIDSSGVALDVQVQGSGRPVVLVHGWPDTKRLWAKQVPALVDAGFQVITYDQRGYGASDKPGEVEAYSIPFLAIDATAILDHLGIERAHFVGHDWGAAVVWAVASLAPDRVDHLVALSVGHPSAFAAMGDARSGRSPGTCCCSSSRRTPSSGSR